MYDISVFIGRFQPFHLGHLHNILIALDNSKKIIINIGSSYNAPNIKNPFTFSQRKKMIEDDLQHAGVDLSRVSIEPLADYFYQEEKWEQALKKNVSKHSKQGQSIAVVGHLKDSSSYYIKNFPEWEYIPVSNYKNYNATDFRKEFYKGHILQEYMCNLDLNKGTYKFLCEFLHTKEYKNLVSENNYVIKYKKSWENAPYKPNLVTVDALVIVNDHILLIKRKNFPGKNLWALPGGFLDHEETISQAIIRELFEETTIDLTIEQLQIAKRAEMVFDYPGRSVRARTISHVGLFVIKEWSSLPKVKVNDDAKSVKWVNIDLATKSMCDRMLEDHHQIITVLLEKYNNKK